MKIRLSNRPSIRNGLLSIGNDRKIEIIFYLREGRNLLRRPVRMEGQIPTVLPSGTESVLIGNGLTLG